MLTVNNKEITVLIENITIVITYLIKCNPKN